jgi:acyl-homoserine-lactone acylase
VPRHRLIAQFRRLRRHCRPLVASIAATVVVAAGGVLALPTPASAQEAAESAAVAVPAGYRAVIRRTAYGVPHVLADSINNVAFGQGWAFGEDRFCDLIDQVIKVNSQRSRWFGPGPGDINIITDFAFKQLGVVDLATQQNARLSTEERQLLDGYVAGYNGFLAKVGAANVPGWCKGQPWVRPVTAIDVLAYQRDIALFASGDALVAPIFLAQPPGAAASTTASTRAAATSGLQRLADLRSGKGGLGSNGWGIGANKSTTGKGMLVANPHFPWEGELRFWESQLTVPGQLNVYGVALAGLPGVQIGFTDKVAWTHTVAAGTRFTFYSVNLVPGQPTKYLVNGVPEAMTARTFTIQVGTGSGLQTLSRTMYSSRYGPMLTIPDQLDWTTDVAFTYRDANIDNDRMLRQWLNIARAGDVNGIRDSIGRDQGIPWVNTIASDAKGNAWYADPSQTPALSAASTVEWVDSGGVLNGSNSANAWQTRAGARSPGLVPFSQQPQLTRRDYVFNANDSHWLANESQLLTGFTPLQGTEGTPVSVRTRQNVRLINGSEPGSVDAYGRFTVAGLGTAILSGSTFTGDELAAAVVTACRARGTNPIDVEGTPVNLTAACNALAGWDRRYELNSSGAVLWRETIASVIEKFPTALNEAGPLFGVAFNAGLPGRTPRGVPSDFTPLLTGLGKATLRLRDLGLAPNVKLRDVQYTMKNAERIPIPGANENVGIANVVNWVAVPGSTSEPLFDGGTFLEATDMTTKGYPVNFGTSFLLTMGFTTSGPSAKAVLSYGESGDPTSSHFADQTRLFSAKQLRDCRFSEASISSDPALTLELVR